MKAVDLLINSKLPPDLRDPTRVLDATGINNLMAEIGRRYPDRYEELSKMIVDTGRHASWRQGETLTLKDLRPVVPKDQILATMEREIAAAKKHALDPDDFAKTREKIWLNYADKLEKDTSSEALRQGNNLAYSVSSGARGKAGQLRALLTTPALYADAKGRTIPFFVRHSFGEGVRPIEFLAGTFGARATVVSTKSSTAKGGDFSKQMVQALASQPVTTKDCGTGNGIDLDINDGSLKHRVLARETEGVPAGTILDRSAISALKKHGVESVIVRSPLTCQAKTGVCAHCVGAWSGGKLPSVGTSVGITAGQAIGEPVTQMALNAKHQGGAASSKKEFSGFKFINQFAQSPEIYPDRAVVAETDGTVGKVEKAPQGGQFVHVGEHVHYVQPGYNLTVKPGDKVEAGDQLSDGLVDAADIVRLRGLGEGRRYYADRLKKILDDSGVPADRRNTEMLARAVMDHVVIDDPEGLGDYLPDDTASYNKLVTSYVPPQDTMQAGPDKAVGKYLQAPALHYSIGTKLTPKMAKHLSKAGISQVAVSDSVPQFRPEMVRLRSASHNNPDWLAKMHSSYLKRNLNEEATRGSDTNIASNVHFAPRLAVGVGFGEHIEDEGRF